MGSITPQGVSNVNTFGCNSAVFTANMDQESSDRIDRLVKWCKTNRVCLDEVGELDAATLSKTLIAKEVKGGYSYWRGMLAKAEDRSFAARKAREVETALGITPLYLEGGDVGWPFSVALRSKLQMLQPEDLRRAENVLRVHLDMPALPPVQERGYG